MLAYRQTAGGCLALEQGMERVFHWQGLSKASRKGRSDALQYVIQGAFSQGRALGDVVLYARRAFECCMFAPREGWETASTKRKFMTHSFSAYPAQHLMCFCKGAVHITRTLFWDPYKPHTSSIVLVQTA